ncbi:MAG: FTR1 family protein [Thermoleophilia bacterium]
MGTGLVLLREGFEASLVVVIVLAFLRRSGRRDVLPVVWAAVGAALAVSFAVGAGLVAVGAELEGRAEAVWEGATMLAAAVLLTWMIFWMRRQSRSIRGEIEGQLQRALDRGSRFGLGLVVFLGVLREGVETALFVFGSFQGAHAASATLGAAIGLTAAVVLAWLMYRGGARLPLGTFFAITSGLLLVFAAYLLATGMEELAEGGLLPENETLMVAGFALLAIPTLIAFFRPRRISAAA